VNSAAAYQRNSMQSPRQRWLRRYSGDENAGIGEGIDALAINPDTGGVRLSQYIPDNAKYSDDLFATHADCSTRSIFPSPPGV